MNTTNPLVLVYTYQLFLTGKYTAKYLSDNYTATALYFKKREFKNKAYQCLLGLIPFDEKDFTVRFRPVEEEKPKEIVLEKKQRPEVLAAIEAGRKIRAKHQPYIFAKYFL
jgi:hypothetical protein